MKGDLVEIISASSTPIAVFFSSNEKASSSRIFPIDENYRRGIL